MTTIEIRADGRLWINGEVFDTEQLVAGYMPKRHIQSMPPTEFGIYDTWINPSNGTESIPAILNGHLVWTSGEPDAANLADTQNSMTRLINVLGNTANVFSKLL